MRRIAGEAAAAAGLSALLSLIVLAPMLTRLDTAWGGQDLTFFYASAARSSGFGFGQTDHYGFPFGSNWDFYANSDVLLNWFVRAVDEVTGSPFVGINALVVISFPVAAALALVAFRLTGLGGPIAVALATSYSLIPYHWVRGFNHVYLATTFSAVTAVILALVIGSGRLERWRALRGRQRVVRYLGLAGLVVVTAWTGVYPAFFALILTLAATVWRIGKGDDWPAIARSLLPSAALIVLVGVATAPSLIARLADPPLAPLLTRSIVSAVVYSGALFAALVPAPIGVLEPYNALIDRLLADAPSMEQFLVGNFGTWITTGCLAVVLIGVLSRARHRMPISPGHASGVTLGYVGYLILVTTLFFVPLGLNVPVAAWLVPQLRSWNRLLPMLLLLFMLAAATVIRTSPLLRRERIAMVAFAGIVVVTGTDQLVSMPAAYAYTMTTHATVVEQARAYAADVNAALPGDCGILDLPYLAFIEPEEQHGTMEAYEHLIVSLTNPDKRFSHGAFKNTAAGAWTAALPQVPTDAQFDGMRRAGFCGVHLDLAGYDPPDAERVADALSTRLGTPVATGADGRWLMFALPAPASVSDPDTWPTDLVTAFHPPVVSLVRPDAPPPNEIAMPWPSAEYGSEGTDQWWWLVAPTATWHVAPSDARAPLLGIDAEAVAPCGPTEVTITLTAGDQVVSTVAHPEPGRPASVALTLPNPSDATAELVMSATGAGCAVTGLSEPVRAQLRNPVFR